MVGAAQEECEVIRFAATITIVAVLAVPSAGAQDLYESYESCEGHQDAVSAIGISIIHPFMKFCSDHNQFADKVTYLLFRKLTNKQIATSAAEVAGLNAEFAATTAERVLEASPPANGSRVAACNGFASILIKGFGVVPKLRTGGSGKVDATLLRPFIENCFDAYQPAEESHDQSLQEKIDKEIASKALKAAPHSLSEDAKQAKRALSAAKGSAKANLCDRYAELLNAGPYAIVKNRGTQTTTGVGISNKTETPPAWKAAIVSLFRGTDMVCH
jgi:hypothetical protein